MVRRKFTEVSSRRRRWSQLRTGMEKSAPATIQEKDSTIKVIVIRKGSKISNKPDLRHSSICKSSRTVRSGEMSPLSHSHRSNKILSLSLHSALLRSSHPVVSQDSPLCLVATRMQMKSRLQRSFSQLSPTTMSSLRLTKLLLPLSKSKTQPIWHQHSSAATTTRHSHSLSSSSNRISLLWQHDHHPELRCAIRPTKVQVLSASSPMISSHLLRSSRKLKISSKSLRSLSLMWPPPRSN